MLFSGAFSKSVQRSCFLAQTAALVAPGGSVSVHLSFLAANVYSALRLKPVSNTSWSPSCRGPLFEVLCAFQWNHSGGSQIRWTGTSGHPHVQHLALGQLQQLDEF